VATTPPEINSHKEKRMSRIDVFLAHPKRTLGVLALVLVAVGVAVGSGANFSASSANPSNTFTAGTLTMSNSSDASAILNASNWKPGDTQTGTVDIANTGSLAGAFTLSKSALSNSDNTNPLSDKINLVVKDCGDFSSGTPTCDAGDPTKYSGTLTAMGSNIALGSFAANEKHKYQFAATFDSSAGNVYQGDDSTATFTWDAAQS
jgi:spore coat-associated protein N